MYTLYASAIKRIAQMLDKVLKRIINGDFQYLSTDINSDLGVAVVSYKINGKEEVETADTFLLSQYFHALSKKQLLELTNTLIKAKLTQKRFVISQDPHVKEVFVVSDTKLGTSKELLIADIYKNDEIVEQLSGSNIRQISACYYKSTVASSTIHKGNMKIINFKKQK